MTPTARRQWPAFVGAVHSRLEAGARAYGDKSFSASPEALALEVQQELLDVCGWAFVLWVRLGAIAEALGGATTGAREGSIQCDVEPSARATTPASTSRTKVNQRTDATTPANKSAVAIPLARDIGNVGNGDSGSNSAGRRYGPTTRRYDDDGGAP